MQNQLEMLRIFKVVAESANFKDASVRLGVSPQSVTRAIKEFEEQLGEPLFYRSTRNTTITEFGRQMAQKCVGVIDQVDALFETNKGSAKQSIEGSVKITMPNAFGRQFLLPALIALSQEYPSIQLDLRFSDLIDNVVADQMDIGVRVGVFGNSRHVARRVRDVKFSIVGAPALIERYGTPQQVSDLCQMPYTGLIDQNTGRMWPWYFASEPECVPTAPVFSTDDPEAELQAVLAGIGFAQLPDFACAEHIRAGKLVAVLPEQSPSPWGVYVYRPQRGPVSERVRVVFDRLVSVLAEARLS
ncbi:MULTISPECIES: LysR family transcriptional regulator [unclassified Methylotenera]|jgi:DNA-binding transcriptional LysR family regulator|uniref:LysR family transcriptional regulator n=1 Tax=unclassified Methylotenera TaxID=2643294 RepID=UPI000369440A|nr:MULTISPECIES: LysR family transcriptional regulator [unclassified Methylotenera]